MLKVIGTFIFALVFSAGISAAPTTVLIENDSFSMELPGKGTISPSMMNLILKESANQMQMSYQDVCAAHDKGSLTVQKVVTTNGATAYDVQLGSCSLCILEDDLL